MPKIARWYDDKSAAVSLRFDDTLQSHVQVVAPMLSKVSMPGTFMVNPGKSLFKKNEKFWMIDVPAMGHDLGNHTMNHRGAVDVKDADFEIGEATRIIRHIFPKRSPLMLFASGGGEKWGGKRWKNASPKYKGLVQKYDLIDLYDGQHDSFGVTWRVTVDDMRRQVEDAIKEGRHQAFSFHRIGSPGWKDRLRNLTGGNNYAFPVDKFESFINYLSSVSDRVWVATLLDILKYEKEFENSTLVNVAFDINSVAVDLIVNTDSDLYNQNLTMVFQRIHDTEPSITQNGIPITDFWTDNNSLVFYVSPVTSRITVHFNQ